LLSSLGSLLVSRDVECSNSENLLVRIDLPNTAGMEDLSKNALFSVSVKASENVLSIALRVYGKTNMKISCKRCPQSFESGDVGVEL
jgi:hypothetical protein